MKTQLALQPATQRKTYYVSLYKNEPTYKNKQLFFAYYGEDYPTEHDAKMEAIKDFLSKQGACGFYNTVTLTEHNGIQLADANEPYMMKSAIVKILAVKRVKLYR